MILDKRPMRRWRRTSCEPGSRAAAADRMPKVPMTNAPATPPVVNAALTKTIRIIHLSLAGSRGRTTRGFSSRCSQWKNLADMTLRLIEVIISGSRN